MVLELNFKKPALKQTTPTKYPWFSHIFMLDIWQKNLQKN